MRDRGPLSVLLIAVVTFVGVRVLGHTAPAEPAADAVKQPGPESKDDSKEDDPAPHADPDDAGDDFLLPLERYCGEIMRDGAPDLKDQLRRPPDAGIEIPGHAVDFLIVGVPDPIDSTSAHLFDGYVDAVQRAMEQHQLVQDRYWFPWRAGEKKAGKGARPARESPAYRSLPGTLLFRSARGCSGSRLLLVFLVGETATAGVHKPALKGCLDAIRKFGGRSRTTDTTVRLLGPAFSGSRASYELALQEWRLGNPGRGRWTFRFLTGSATGIVRDGRGDDPGFINRLLDGGTIEFSATVIPEHMILETMFERLGVGTPEKRVAVLAESNTTFGAEAFSGVKGDKQSPKYAGIIKLPFPLHISELRSAYAKVKADPAGALPNLPDNGARLQLPLEEGGGARDTEPSLTPAMTAAETELVLGEHLDAVARERIHYVAILASDAKDTLFLARAVRDHCPDLQILLPRSDLLYSHPDYRYYLKGAVVGSTYPLYPKNLGWSYPFGEDERLLFSDQWYEGVYNAAVLLTKNWPQGEAETEDSPGGENEAKRPLTLKEYGPPFVAGMTDWRPPVWVSVLGQDGPHPLAWMEPRTMDEYARYVRPATEDRTAGARAETAEPHFQPRNTGFWIVPFAAFSLFAFALSVACLVGFFSADGGRWDGFQGRRAWLNARGLLPSLWNALREWNTVGLFRVGKGFEGEHAAHSVLLFAALSVCYGYVAAVGLIPLVVWLLQGRGGVVNLDGSAWVTPLLGLAAFLALSAAAAAALQRLLTPPGAARRRALWPFLWLLTASVFAGAVGLGLWFLLADQFPSTALFFFERCTNLSCGVTPVVPVALLGLGFVFWTVSRLKRLSLAGRFNPDAPLPPRSPQAERLDKMTVEAMKPAYRLPLFWLGVVVLLLCFCRLYSGWIATVEGATFDWCVGLAFFLFSLVLLAAFVRAWVFWKHLRDFLRTVLLLPLTEAFDRVPSAVVGLFGPYLSSPRSPWDGRHPLRRRQLTALARHYRALPQADRQALDGEWKRPEAGERLAAFFTPPGNAAPDEGATEFGERDFAQAARACLNILRDHWAERPLEEMFAAPAKKPPPAPAAPLAAWRHMAEDFVAVEFVAYVSQYFALLRMLVQAVTVCALLLFLAAVSYPFQPQNLLILFVGGLLLTAAGGFSVMFVQMERDELISRILKTTPNRITFNWTFLSSILVYIVPLLGVLASVSPDLSNLLHSWLDPLRQILR